MPQREISDLTDEIEIEAEEQHPFTQVPKWVTAMVGAGALSFGAHFLYVVLLGYTERSRGSAFPSKKTLMAAAGRSKRITDGYIAELEAVGAVRIQRRPQADGPHRSNLYRLAVSRPFRPVDNSPAVDNAPSQTVDKGEGAENSTLPPAPESGGEGAENSTQEGAADSTRSITIVNKKKEMPTGSAGSAARSAEPVENPDAEAAEDAPARPTVADDFAAWWTLYRTEWRRQANGQPGDKGAALRAYMVARKKHSAAELLDGLTAAVAVRSADRRAGHFVPGLPYAARGLRERVWEQYAPSGAVGAADGPEAARASSDAFRRAEALRGPYTPPELPHDVSADDYRLAVAADRADFLAGHGRWERPTP